MKYLEKALEMNEIDAEHREKTIREYEAAKERIKNLPLTLSDDADAMLSNHLVALIKRYKPVMVINVVPVARITVFLK